MSGPNPTPATKSSSTSKPPPPPLDIAQTALLHPTASLIGTHPVTISAKAIVQLRSRIDSTHGPIRIGSEAFISERAWLGVLVPASPSSVPTESRELSVGDGATIESAAILEPGCSIGAHSRIEVGVRIRPGAQIGKHCTICPKVEIAQDDVIGDGMVVWGSGSMSERRLEREGRGFRVEEHASRQVHEGIGSGMRALWTGK